MVKSVFCKHEGAMLGSPAPMWTGLCMVVVTCNPNAGLVKIGGSSAGQPA